MSDWLTCGNCIHFMLINPPSDRGWTIKWSRLSKSWGQCSLEKESKDGGPILQGESTIAEECEKFEHREKERK